MSCCSSKNCAHVYAPWFPRIGFGVALAGFGVSHLRFIGQFTDMAGSVFTNAALASVFSMLAYVVPFLMIVGGVLFAVKKAGCISKFCILAALGGILGWAGLAIMLGSMEVAGSMGSYIQNAGIFIILYYTIKKMSCCGSGCCTPTK